MGGRDPSEEVGKGIGRPCAGEGQEQRGAGGPHREVERGQASGQAGQKVGEKGRGGGKSARPEWHHCVEDKGSGSDEVGCGNVQCTTVRTRW